MASARNLWKSDVSFSATCPGRRHDVPPCSAEAREGLGLQLSNSNFDRMFFVQREKTNSWLETSQPQQHRWSRQGMSRQEWRLLQGSKWLLPARKLVWTTYSIKIHQNIILTLCEYHDYSMALPREAKKEIWKLPDCQTGATHQVVIRSAIRSALKHCKKSDRICGLKTGKLKLVRYILESTPYLSDFAQGC